MIKFQYKSLASLHPEWSVDISVCSRNSLGRVDALSMFDCTSNVFSVIYRKDYGPIVANPDPRGLIREPIEWGTDIRELAQSSQCSRFKTDHQWRVSNAEFVSPCGRQMGLVAWIQEESARAKELLAWMKSSGVDNVRDLLRG